MARAQFLDLDVLDSPAISIHDSVSSSRLSSSIAEKIFNDPHSWHEADETLVGDEEMKDVVTWLAEEPERYDGHAGGGIGPLPSIDQSLSCLQPKRFSACHKLISEPAITSSRMSGIHMKWDGVWLEEEDYASLPPFELPCLDLNMDLDNRLSKVWDARNTSPQSLPSPIIFSPFSSPSTGRSVISPDTTRTSTSLPPLDLAIESARSSTPITSPVTVLSASTTWSILELYGVHPDTPDSGRPLIGPHPSVILPVSPTAISPISRPTTPPPSLLTIQLSAALKATNEATSIRPLPLVPDSVRGSPTPPPHIETPKTLSGEPSKPLRPPFHPSNSAPALPSRKTPLRLYHDLPKSKQPLLPDIPPAPSFSKPPGLSRKQAISLGHQHSREPRSPAPLRTKAANITRFVSLPLPSPRFPAPEPVPPSAVPSSRPGRPGSAVRSPPLGPRAQSTMLPLQSQ